MMVSPLKNDGETADWARLGSRAGRGSAAVGVAASVCVCGASGEDTVAQRVLRRLEEEAGCARSGHHGEITTEIFHLHLGMLRTGENDHVMELFRGNFHGIHEGWGMSQNEERRFF